MKIMNGLFLVFSLFSISSPILAIESQPPNVIESYGTDMPRDIIIDEKRPPTEISNKSPALMLEQDK